MRAVLILIFGMDSFSVLGGEIKYPVAGIPEALKENVNAVVREDQTVYTIYSRSKASVHAVFAITIFNEKGKQFATHYIPYNKLISIKEISGAVYDENGKAIKKLKRSEIVDQSAYDGFSLYSDARFKYMDLSQTAYPYTVEFEWEVEYRYLYGIDDSTIVPEEKISVQHSSYQLIYPPDLKPRIKTLNISSPDPKTEIMTNGMESMKWSFENVKPIKFEPMGPYHRDILPQILAAPGQFEYDGYAGNMSTWEDFGKWNLLLGQGRDQLPEGTRQKVKELTNGLTTIEQKAKVLYEYMQSKTRYVSIQLGIGGLQPFEASVVDQVGYGDCKALSNYMVAMLKEAGVKGYYTTVMAGRNEPKLMSDFPSHQFNHVIVAVPNGVDTLWLECTSQTMPFAYQGTFTGDRKALMITENGGKIVNTTRYSAEQNRQIRTADVFVDKTGAATAHVRTTYAGEQYENDRLFSILDNQYDAQKKWVQNNTDIPTFDIKSFSMVNRKARIPAAVVDLELVLNRFANVSGKRLFLTPNLMNRSTFVPEKVENRKTNVVLKGMSYMDLDTIRYHMPEEIYPEFLPEPVKITSRFGEYEAAFKIEQGQVLYIRKIVFRKGEFPASSYQELIEFYKDISRADNKKLVFLNKT